MYWLYQASTLLIIIYMLFTKINTTPPIFYIGMAVYACGVLLFILSTIAFATYSGQGVCQNGIYRFSRNPMYVAYFIYFLGCALLTQSLLLFALVGVFQIAAHWVILSEERWCSQNFDATYTAYKAQVRRYIGRY